MKTSFVILTWNRYQFLEKCIESLISSIQNPNDCEIVIMDNGSSDNTYNVLKQYRNNSLIRIILRKKNHGLKAYKRLFWTAKGDHIVVVDDDVLQFPKGIDNIFLDYMKTFDDYGFIALDVIQNEFTNGAKPGLENYANEVREGKTIQRGPTGGWCACFRKKDFRKIMINFFLTNLNMKQGEDGVISHLLNVKLGLKAGIAKDIFCFHASGPHYAKEYGHLNREIEKYTASGLQSFVDTYKEYK